MSGWNHRVVRHVCKRWSNSAEESRLEVQEVYYGIVHGGTPPVAERAGDYHHGSVSLIGDDVPELKMVVGRIFRALDAPVLDCKCDAMDREAEDHGQHDRDVGTGQHGPHTDHVG